MRIHEYQAKRLLSLLGVEVPKGHIAYTEDEASKAALDIRGDNFMVKAQIHSGGRAKAGGILHCRTIDQVCLASRKLLDSLLVTPQEEAMFVKKVYVECSHKIEKEFYLSLTFDRFQESIAIIVSHQGGIDVEENPCLKININPVIGLQDFHIRRVFNFLSLDKELYPKLHTTLVAMFQAYTLYDATLIEINPLALSNNSLVALDAKMVFDDNALYRHPDIQALLEFNFLSTVEEEALNQGMHYVKLDGNIGCLINGAGLAMATLDLIVDLGGKPANFLDSKGSADEIKIKDAFKLILSDSTVDVIFVNIFGGILSCNTLAQGLVLLSRNQPIAMPIVIRFQGNNSDNARELLRYSSLNVLFIDDLKEAAKKVVELSKR